MAPTSQLERVSEEQAIEMVAHVGDVGTTNQDLLRRLLPHCSAEQLEHIETKTAGNGRDLSPITDELWRMHYGQRFGKDHTSMLEERIAKAGRTFLWRRLYKAKVWEQEKLQAEGLDRLRELYQQQIAKKNSRKIQVIDMSPPESRKRIKTASGPISEGSTRSSNPKKPASANAPAPAGRTLTEPPKELQEKALSTKDKQERGRLWRKSLKDFNKRKLMMKPAPLPRRPPVD